MEISHEKARWLMELRTDSRLNEQELAMLARHLQDCVECRSYAGDMSQVESALTALFRRRWSHPPVPLSIPALRETTEKAKTDTLVTMRKIAMGLVVASFFFSVWQLALSSSSGSGPIPLIAAPIPTPSTDSTSTSAPRLECEMVRYTTRPGDTLEGIAAMFSTSVEEIRAANALPGEPIHTGIELVVPGCRPTPTGTINSPSLTRTHLPPWHLLTTTPGAKY